MSNTKLFIPKTLNVGYQVRKDTYTEKLAYVIYYDEKGKLRKETSWKNWCEHFIGDTENKPTSGFVLNRGVGGARRSWGWNARNEYIRVYDPRGWEFEISVSNLLFILQECTSTKGKGLEGEFVYSWHGTELVLLPVGCEEYKESSKFTSIQSKKVTQKEMKEGRMYRFKDTTEAMYLGRHECNEDKYGIEAKPKLNKYHIFYIPNREKYQSQYRFERGFTKLGEVLEDSPEYGEKLEEFLNSYHCNGIKAIDWKPLKIGNLGHNYQEQAFVDFHGKILNCYLVKCHDDADYKNITNRRTGRNNYWNNSYYAGHFTINELLNGEVPDYRITSSQITNYTDLRSKYYYSDNRIVLHYRDLEEFKKITIVKPTLILENNEEMKYER